MKMEPYCILSQIECLPKKMGNVIPHCRSLNSYFYQILEIFAGLARKTKRYQQQQQQQKNCDHMLLFAYSNKTYAKQNNQ